MGQTAQDVAHPTKAASGSQKALRERNRRAVMDQLAQRGPMIQSELVRSTGLSNGTISNIVKALSQSGAVSTRHVVSGGRRATQVVLARDSRLVLGVDIGRAHLRAALFNSEQVIVAQSAEQLDRDHDPRITVQHVEDILGSLLGHAGASLGDIALGVFGLPASISPQGNVIQASVLPKWAQHNLRELIEDTFEFPIILENDANLGALAINEQLGVEAGNLIYVKVGTGVGAGLMLDGRLYRSSSGLVGELGHIQVVENGGICTCGNRGCLETVLSARRLVEDFNVMRRLTDATLDDLIQATNIGDHAVLTLVRDAGLGLGRALAIMCNVFAPDHVVVGGTLGQATEVLLESAQNSIRHRGLPAAAKNTKFSVSGFGEFTELVGAGALGVATLRTMLPA